MYDLRGNSVLMQGHVLNLRELLILIMNRVFFANWRYVLRKKSGVLLLIY